MPDQKQTQTRPREAKGRKLATIKGIAAPEVIEMPNRVSTTQKDRLDAITKLADAIAHASLTLNALLAEEQERR